MVFVRFTFLKYLHLKVELGFRGHSFKLFLFALMIFVEVISNTTLFLYPVFANFRVELVCLGLERGQRLRLRLFTVLNVLLKSYKN